MRPPRPPAARTRLRGGLLAAVLLVVAGCAGEEEPHAVAEGRYHYAATHPAPGSGEPVRLEGVLVITHAAEDSIAGRFEVPDLHPEMELGAWTGEAYEVLVNPTYFGILTHRIRPGAGGALGCSGDYTWIASGGEERTVPVECELAPEAGVRPEMPERGEDEPVVREIDADTVPAPATRAPSPGAGT